MFAERLPLLSKMEDRLSAGGKCKEGPGEGVQDNIMSEKITADKTEKNTHLILYINGDSTVAITTKQI